MSTELTLTEHLEGCARRWSRSRPVRPTAPGSRATCRPARTGPCAAWSPTRGWCTAGPPAPSAASASTPTPSSARGRCPPPTRWTGCATAPIALVAGDRGRPRGRRTVVLPQRRRRRAAGSGRGASATRRPSTPSTRSRPRSARYPGRRGHLDRPRDWPSTASTSCSPASSPAPLAAAVRRAATGRRPSRRRRATPGWSRSSRRPPVTTRRPGDAVLDAGDVELRASSVSLYLALWNRVGRGRRGPGPLGPVARAVADHLVVTRAAMSPPTSGGRYAGMCLDTHVFNLEH